MDNLQNRLTGCFRIVFPDLPEDQLVSASQESVAQWDSIAAITLMNVIEEEFQTTIDFDQLADLDSFPRILQYLEKPVS
jgi:acyl carrier protein